MSDSIIGWDKDGEGIVTLTIDDPDNGANMLTDAYVEQMGAMIDRLEAEVDETTGVVITSGKSTFFAGADLTQIRSAGPEHAQQLFDGSTAIKRDLRRLETLGNRSSPRSTAPRWAAGWSWRWRPITASRPTWRAA